MVPAQPPVLLSLFLALATVPASSQSGDFLLVETTPPGAGPGGDARWIVALGSQPEQYHLFTRDEWLGAFEVSPTDTIVPAVPPVVTPATPLGPGETWALTGSTVGVARLQAVGGVLQTSYKGVGPGGASVVRDGNWWPIPSERVDAIFFVQGGHVPSDTMTLAVVETLTGAERMAPLSRAAMGEIRASDDGSVMALKVGDRIEVFDGPTRLTVLTDRLGVFQLSRSGDWIASRVGTDLELQRFDPPRILTVPLVEPVSQIVFDDEQVLVVERTRARRFDLSTPTPTDAAQTIFVETGFRFTSADLRLLGGAPWTILGELQVIVPQYALPDAPVPRADLLVRIFDASETRATWSAAVNRWRGSNPEVRWSQQGRAMFTTSSQYWVSLETLP